MKNNIREKMLGSKKRRIATTLVLVSFLMLFFYAEHVMAGTMFVLGTQNLEPLDGRFSAQNTESVEDEKPWIQDSYQDEINSLSEREYYITQQNGTEPPFQNELYDEKRQGIYVDVVSGEPLFSSKHKFDSGTGWPSFYKPLEPENIIERKDPGPLGTRVEIASRHARSHLGHLFRDGPEDKTGLRYCMNSAALEFIPADQLEQRGYGKYSSMFENQTE